MVYSTTLQSVRRTVAKCKTFFDKHYLLANVGVYGTLYCLGDITCQTLSHASTDVSHDWQRTKRMTMMGCTILPIMNTYFYRALDKVIVGTSLKLVVLKLAIDTLAWTPVTIFAFIGAITVLEGKEWSKVKEEIRIKFFPVYKSSLLVWPTAQAINFAFVHPRFRMAYISVIGFCWVNILSYLKHKQKMPKPAPDGLK